MTINLIGKRVDVLDKGFVELIDQMPHPASGISADFAVVQAARVSFMQGTKGEEADAKLIDYMIRNAHTSPLEQVRFKFRVKAPLLVFWQWVRHRTFSFQQINSESGRYVEFAEDEFYMPAAWRLQSTSNKQGSDGHADQELDNHLTVALDDVMQRGYSMYNYAVNHGIAKEQARLFLPGFGVFYTWIISVDAWNLMAFLKLRLAAEAQYEIRVYANALYNEFFKEIMPVSAASFEKHILKVEKP